MGDLIIPPRCGLCDGFIDTDRVPGPICDSCWEKIDWAAPESCRLCCREYDDWPSFDRVCPDCHLEPPLHAGAAFAAAYREPLAGALRKFKYRSRVNTLKALGRVFRRVSLGPEFPKRFEMIIPVPLHPKRLQVRGFNQAAMLARELPDWGPVRVDVLVRVRNTTPQVELTGPARRENVVDAFALAELGHTAIKDVLLVDDIATTGSTLRECTRVLLNGGVARVWVLTLARAMGF